MREVMRNENRFIEKMMVSEALASNVDDSGLDVEPKEELLSLVYFPLMISWKK